MFKNLCSRLARYFFKIVNYRAASKNAAFSAGRFPTAAFLIDVNSQKQSQNLLKCRVTESYRKEAQNVTLGNTQWKFNNPEPNIVNAF